MYGGTVDGAEKQFLVLNDPVLVIQEQAGEHLVRVVAHAGQQIPTGVGHALDGIATLQGLLQITPRQFQHRLQLHVLGRSQPWRRAEPRLIQFQQLTQAFMLLEHVPRQIHRAAARYADP